MTVEFRCSRCERLLRTPDGSAGKQTKCPQCGEILTVPEATAPSGVPHAANQPSAPASPFAGGSENPAQPTAPYPGAPHPGTPFPAAEAGPSNPYQSPGSTFAPAPMSSSEIVPTRIDLGDVMTRGWTIFQAQMGMTVLGIFLVLVLTTVPNWMVGFLVQIATVAQIEPAVVLALNVLLQIGLWIYQIWIYLGQTAFILQIARGEQPDIKTLFTGSRYIVPGVLAGLFFMLILFVPALLCFAPAGGVYVATQDENATLIAALVGASVFAFIAAWLSLTYMYYQVVIVDRDCGVMEGFSTSAAITKGNKLTLLGMGLVMVVLYFVGLLACCVGAIFPISYAVLTMFGVAYLAMTGRPTAEQFMAPRVSMPAAPPQA